MQIVLYCINSYSLNFDVNKGFLASVVLELTALGDGGIFRHINKYFQIFQIMIFLSPIKS